jgi:cytochrome c-type biogenesis protein CcmH/NrfG
MRSESIVFAISGMCFGIILGWVIGTQQATKRTGAVVQMQSGATEPQQSANQQTAGTRQPPALDEAKVQGLMTIIKSDPKNAGAHVQLGNAYFDAERYPDAIKWYEEGLKLDPKNVDASTDLAVSYYYSSRTDEALKQLDYSLKLDPAHAKTLLNQGIILAFGKRDLKGATAAWEKVVQLAPNSPEAQAAKQGLQGIAAATGRGGTPAPAPGAGG